MRLRWTPLAADDLVSIHSYLHEYHPAFAQPTVRLIFDATRRLRDFPRSGRPGTVAGTRELVLPRLPYIIIYRATSTMIEVIRIYHGAQERSRH
jgi:toxin ParE1/3/4